MYIFSALFFMTGCGNKSNKEVQSPVAAEAQTQESTPSPEYDVGAMKDILGVELNTFA